jgi:hypothetical protein
VWLDRRGQQQPIPAAPGAYADVRLSPGGTRLAMTHEADIWDAKTTRIISKLAGKVVTTQTIVVSGDGKTRTTTTKGTDAKGQKVDTISFYEKQ